MSLWAFIPGKHILSVGALPRAARRIDTNEWVDLTGDGVQWARACGWWDLDNIDVPLLTSTNKLTPAELAVVATERATAVAARQGRRQWVEDVETAWAFANSALADHLSEPPSPTPPSPGNVSQSLIYLYDRVQELTRVIAGGGTIQTPGIGDALIVLARALLEQIEQDDTLDIS